MYAKRFETCSAVQVPVTLPGAEHAFHQYTIRVPEGARAEVRAAAEKARVAAEGLEKAVEQGKELFNSKKLGRKSCASCHEDPDKPNVSLTARSWSYPAYSRRARGVVTLSQKINEMIKFQARGPKDVALDDERIIALAAYVESLH